MSKTTHLLRALPLAATAAALALAGATARAQEPAAKQEVKIEAGKIVTLSEGHSHTGIQTEKVQLSHNVSFSDLDLTTSRGALELESRVRDAANSVCRQLKDLNPASSTESEELDQKTCVTGAVHTAMIQAHQAVASAQEAKKRG